MGRTKGIVLVLLVLAWLLLMPYSQIGSRFHEWLGLIAIVGMAYHLYIQRHWFSRLWHGPYPVFRVVQSLLNVGLLACLVGITISALIITKHTIPNHGWGLPHRLAKMVHLFSAYWGFLLVGLHIGFHGPYLLQRLGVIGRMVRWGVGLATLYGVYAFIQLDIASYMTGQQHFAFFDLESSPWVTVAQYVAVLCLYMMIGMALQTACRNRNE